MGKHTVIYGKTYYEWRADLGLSESGWAFRVKEHRAGRLTKEQLLTPTSQIKKGRPQKEFWSLVNRLGEDDCWEWKAGRNSSGYGVYRFEGVSCVASRIAYLLSFGGITALAPTDPESDQFVLHWCDNRVCCNPKHLHLGTQSINQLESYERRRRAQPKGQFHTNAKLTNEQAAEIRTLYAAGARQVDLAKQFNISQVNISKIIRNQTYK